MALYGHAHPQARLRLSIGKPVLFNLSGEFTIDSHVVILRPAGLSPLALVYLLASPLGQMQFRRAESGASGQTTVTEDDVRRFIFPRSILKTVDKIAVKIESKRMAILKQRRELAAQEAALWKQLDQFFLFSGRAAASTSIARGNQEVKRTDTTTFLRLVRASLGKS